MRVTVAYQPSTNNIIIYHCQYQPDADIDYYWLGFDDDEKQEVKTYQKVKKAVK